MKQTFKGFLQAYCAELAGERTASIRRLCNLAAGDVPRLAEPLFLLAFERGQLGLLLKVSAGTRLEKAYQDLAAQSAAYPSAEAFAGGKGAPMRLRAVYDAFHERDDMLAADRRIVALMRERTLAALEASGLTRYRLCSDLGLNMGNVYAYLAGNDAKVSREMARRIMEYAQGVAAFQKGDLRM